MYRKNNLCLWRPAATLSALSLVSSAFCHTAKRPFTPADDVGLAQFNWYQGSESDPARDIKYSPDHRYFVVVTEKGRLDLNAPEDTIWIFRVEDVKKLIQKANQNAESLAVPLYISAAVEKKGPSIEHLRWLDDSTSIVFTELKRSQQYRFHQLFLMNISTRKVEALTPEDQDVRQFDVRTKVNYTYIVQAPALLNSPRPEANQPTVLTGIALRQILFADAAGSLLTPFTQAGLWAVLDGNARHVLDAKSINQHDFDNFLKSESLSLSPDGHQAVVILGVEHVPGAWAKYKAEPVNKLFAKAPTAAYHIVDLQTGIRKLLVNAPVDKELGWIEMGFAARWSADGKSLILPDIFLPLDGANPTEVAERKNSPWIAVLRLDTGQLTGVLPIKGGSLLEHDFVSDARFANAHTVIVHFNRALTHFNDPAVGVFQERSGGSWEHVGSDEAPFVASLPFKVEVRESTNQSPIIVGTDKGTGSSRIVWDPNPQLKAIELGLAETIHWSDDKGYEYQGALLKPPRFVSGERYPLVIQPYAFSPKQFLSYGRLTSGTAARVLSAAGMVVVQASLGLRDDRREEGPNAIAKFNGLVKKLSEESIIDPARVGVMGFSRTVYHVMFDLAFNKYTFAAASISDGVDFGYLQYMMYDTSIEADEKNGGKPLDEAGLESWRERSPEFNLDKIETPLLLLPPSEAAVLENWEEYAGLFYQHKPVDLVMLPPPVEHEISNPVNRLYSETLYTDWFRFWLQGYEDPEPAKGAQYRRWRELRKLQDASQAQTRPRALKGPEMLH